MRRLPQLFDVSNDFRAESGSFVQRSRLRVLEKHVEREQRVALSAGPLLGCRDESLADAAPSRFRRDDQIGDMSTSPTCVVVGFDAHVCQPERLAAAISRYEDVAPDEK